MKVKFCGLRTAADVEQSARLACDAVGFVFVPESRRYVTIEQANPLVNLARQLGLVTVALVANSKAEQIEEIIRCCQPDVIQFHGAESVEFCTQFQYRYWKAIPMLNDIDWRAVVRTHKEAEMFLLDAYSDHKSGGSGTAFKWFRFPEPFNQKMILAGGLNTENLSQAIDETATQYIDISSGIEVEPGVKSHAKMQQIMQIITSIE